MKKVLVAYISKGGSTKELAEHLAVHLGTLGFEADVKDMLKPEEIDLGAYQAAVLGAPVHGMSWVPEALAFVKNKADQLSAIPCAYFLLSIAYGVGRDSWKTKLPACFAPVKAVVPAVSTACFGGRMDQDPPFILRLAFGIKKGAPKDGRDWAAVETWAQELKELFA